MKELKIGEEIRIRCVEDNLESCKKCFFWKMNCEDIGTECRRHLRADGKDVHFEIVEE